MVPWIGEGVTTVPPDAVVDVELDELVKEDTALDTLVEEDLALDDDILEVCVPVTMYSGGIVVGVAFTVLVVGVPGTATSSKW